MAIRTFLLFSLIFFCIVSMPAAAAENSGNNSDKSSGKNSGKPAAHETDALALESCTLSAAYGLRQVDAQCGWFSVPENRADPDSPVIELRVAVIPARTSEPAGNPIFFIAGGPGQSAIDGYLAMSGAFETVDNKRDIVLLVQRGTGKSNPLTCPQADDPLAVAPSPEEVRELVSECLAQLDGDPRYYTTSVAVDDLDAVREALGYEQINLYGISYGTRVALHYLRQYPDHVRSVVIDGVVPPTRALGPGIAISAQQALEKQFARCQAHADCQQTYPDLQAEFEKLLAGFSEPRELQLPDPLTGEPMTFTWRQDHLRGAVRLLSYQTATTSLLPLLITQAAQGNVTPLAAQAVMVAEQMSGAMALGMHNAVVCTEDLPFAEISEGERAAIADTYLGTTVIDALQTTCDIWPAGVIDDNFKQPVTSDKPVLLLSGEFDPVTPPAFAQQVAEHLPNSLHIVAPGQGHGVAASGCIPRLIDKFYKTASVENLDTGCVDKLQAAPFFLRFTGPNP